jgi:hypothetical protein
MSLRRTFLSAEFLQWFGLGGAAAFWACQHVLGFGVTVARCGANGLGSDVSLHTWELATGAVALAFTIAAEAAAAVVVRRTGGVAYDGPAADGRRRFFALAALVGNLLFAVVILMSTLSVITFDPCRQG